MFLSQRFVLLFNLVPLGAPVEHGHAAVAAAKGFGLYPFRGPDDIRIEPRRSRGSMSGAAGTVSLYNAGVGRGGGAQGVSTRRTDAPVLSLESGPPAGARKRGCA